MSGKPFCLGAAQRGDAVQYENFRTGWEDVHFVGKELGGCMLVQNLVDKGIFTVPPSSLRMAPKPQKEMWVQLFASMTGVPLSTSPKESPDAAKVAAAGAKLIGDPQKVLVPGES